MSENTELTVDLLIEIGEAFNSHDTDRIASYFADDAVFFTARGPDSWGYEVAGKETIRDYLAARFEVIPDMSWEREDQYACGDRGVTVWTVKGKSANGEDLNYRGCDLYEFRNRKIVRKDTYWKIVDPDDLGGLPTES